MADLHLSFGTNKPMDVFGATWERHAERIERAWREQIADEDVVLIPGDISWAMRENEALPDFAFLTSLPGRKILLRGNHDYWWSTKRKVEKLAGSDFSVLQNNAIPLAYVTIVGTRGWDLPHSKMTAEDHTIYRREVERLRLSLEAGKKMDKPLIAMMHYPPITRHVRESEFSKLLEAYNVKLCVYGHLHGNAHQTRVEGIVRNVDYHLVAADFLKFSPLQLAFHSP
ncbi:metallophosphoesterase [Ferroacidibacillus organovorans]|uniref:metallophosphoesterase n=1 Tax=Ferroacidibacillus organovorans TaxID=1765683 RepID=UPI0022B2310C|nr:metallophosphoesterase [Ferroacidibacillus organovorans]